MDIIKIFQPLTLLKATILFILLFVLQAVFTLIGGAIFDPLISNNIKPTRLFFYQTIVFQIPTILGYILILILFFRHSLNLIKGVEKIKLLQIIPILIVAVIAVGYELFNQPFFDLYAIINTKKLASTAVNESGIPTLVILHKGISALLIAPVFEELFFRKIIFGGLQKKYSLFMAILVSSVFFSAIHLPSVRNIIPTFIFGIICCLIYYKTGNIFYTIIFHFLSNFVWLLQWAYLADFNFWMNQHQFDFIYWILFISGITLTYFGLKKIITGNFKVDSVQRSSR